MLKYCNIKKVSLIFILTAALLLYPSITPLCSSADNKNIDTIVFLGNEKIAPIVYKEEGIAKGVAVDIAQGIGRKTGYKIEVEAIDWDEAQKKVLSGEADALLQINPNSEREKLYDFSDELLKSEFSIFVGYGNFDIKTANDLKNKSVGVEYVGYPYHLLQKYDGVNTVVISDWGTGFQMLKSGELDAVVVDRWIGEYELTKSKTKGIQVVEKPIEIQYSRIAVKKGNNELLGLINSGLKALNEDGTMTDILRDWRGEKVICFTQERIKNTFLYSAIVVLILILLATLYLIHKFRKMNRKLKSDVIKRTQELNEINEKLRKVNEELERMSMMDGLTNISNRRYFDSSLEKKWGISKRERLPLALIMIDIDNFKIFNDTYGHLAGDQCLKNVANMIKSTVKRTGDFVARFGGEEFIVLLFNTKKEGAAALAEEIRINIENLGIKNEGISSVVTVSLGVAVAVPDQDLVPNDLIEAADQAMYQAKKNGRNRVEISDFPTVQNKIGG